MKKMLRIKNNIRKKTKEMFMRVSDKSIIIAVFARRAQKNIEEKLVFTLLIDCSSEGFFCH